MIIFLIYSDDLLRKLRKSEKMRPTMDNAERKCAGGGVCGQVVKTLGSGLSFSFQDNVQDRTKQCAHFWHAPFIMSQTDKTDHYFKRKQQKSVNIYLEMSRCSC